MCHCGAVVKELLARADKPGSTPVDAFFCFSVSFFFSCLVCFVTTILPFGLFTSAEREEKDSRRSGMYQS